jgi:DNA polymerase-3 subunit delta'
VLPENDEIKIESVRQAEEVLSLKPYEGKVKVLIMDDADRMNISAANAFLKTLEEPPGDSLIILISSDPDRLPDTIRSRCMHIRFRPLSGEACKQVVSTVARVKDIGDFKALAMGRPGIAITKDFAAEKKWFMDILNAISRGETRCPWTDKNEIKKWLDLCTVWLRDVTVFASTGRDSDLLYGEKRTARDFAAALEAYQRIQKVRGLIDLNLNKSITWNFVSGIIQEIVAQPVSGRR